MYKRQACIGFLQSVNPGCLTQLMVDQRTVCIGNAVHQFHFQNFGNAEVDVYKRQVNANVHRGVHFLSQQATELHEASRETVRRFINARSTNEIVFTRGTKMCIRDRL